MFRCNNRMYVFKKMCVGGGGVRAFDRYIYVYNIYDYCFLVTYRTIAPGAISDILNVF